MLSDKIIQEIEKDYSCEVVEHRYRLQLNKRKSIYSQILRTIERIDFNSLPTDVIINLPSDALAAVYVVNEISNNIEVVS